MRTKDFSSAPYKFLAALAIIAMVLGALPAKPASAATTITVTTTADEYDASANGFCSLREAIANANNDTASRPDCPAGTGTDTIVLASGSTYTLSNAGGLGDLDITDADGLTIQATGSVPAIIDGSGQADHVLQATAASGDLTLNYITVRNGNALTGAGINFASSAGTLTLNNSTVSNNTATGTGGCGGGIYNNTSATINITRSTIQNNTCSDATADGGGLFKGTGGILNITGSTFSNNNTGDNGGGLHLAAGTATILNSTFAGNTAGTRGGGIQVGGGTATIEFSTFSDNAANGGVSNGGAIQVSSGSVSIIRSIFANSTAGKDCDQAIGASAVFTNSLVENNNDCTGSITSTMDPGLGTLGNNGGPTQTMAITTSSPAYNAAGTCGTATTDQRGTARPQNVLCDLGAFEVVPDLTAPTVVSVVRASASPTNAASVDFTVAFSESVTGVDASDFSLNITGVTSPAITSVNPSSGFATTYTVTVNTGTGSGTILLDVLDDDSIVDASDNPLAGPFNSGEAYTIDKTPPIVSSVTRVDPSPTDAYKVRYTVTFSEPVTGAGGTSTDFSLTVSGITGAAVASVSGSGTTYTVTVNAGDGNGTLRLNVEDDDSIMDAVGNRLGGAGTGNGKYTSGEVYTIERTIPAATTLVSPDGSITEYKPTYTWNEVPGATWYYLWVQRPSGNPNPIKIWYKAFDICNGSTCSATPAVTLGGGTHTFWVRTWNSVGYGPWSDSMSFDLPTPTPPGAATLVSPYGTISTDNPTYTWNEVSGATWYYLWVNRPSGNPIKEWYQATDVCSSGVCSTTSGTPLSPGDHTWWIRTYNDAGGYGPWSSAMSFKVPVPPPPGAATLVSPFGAIGNKTPTYTWNEVSGATYYYLWVNGPSGNVIKQWYTSAQAACNGTTCSVTPTTGLAAGAYTWWVRTWNLGGYGPWSSAMSFSLAKPGAATLVSPNATIGTNKPAYTWNEVSGATYYYLWVNGPSGNVIKQWYTSAQAACNGSTCSVTPNTALASGNHTWWIQTWNELGYGPWSTGTGFSVP